MATTTKKPTQFTIGSKEFPVRFSFLHAFTPQDQERDDGTVTQMYGAQIIFSKKDKETKAKLDACVKAAWKEKAGDKTMPSTLKLPLRDGDEEWEDKGEHLKGNWFYNCSSKQKPEVVGTKKDDFGNLVGLTESEIKSGDYGRVSGNMYFFDTKNKGIAVGLGNIQLLKEGDPLGNRTSAKQDFGDFEDDDEGFGE